MMFIARRKEDRRTGVCPDEVLNGSTPVTASCRSGSSSGFVRRSTQARNSTIGLLRRERFAHLGGQIGHRIRLLEKMNAFIQDVDRRPIVCEVAGHEQTREF